MRNKATSTCDKISNCIYAFFSSPYWCSRIVYRIELKTEQEWQKQKQKEEEHLQEEKDRLLPWGSA